MNGGTYTMRTGDDVDTDMWIGSMCAMLDAIEQADTIEEAHAICHDRFRAFREAGVVVNFSGIQASMYPH